MPDIEAIRAAARDARTGDLPDVVQGPVINAPVWTWEIPLYFWFGGIAAGSSFVALACDLAGDDASARVARKVALAALMPSPPLLIMDLGRPERFYNMLRIFKPRSPMSMGAWALTRVRRARRGARSAPTCSAASARRSCSAAPTRSSAAISAPTPACCWPRRPSRWGRSRLFLGPIFVSTATRPARRPRGWRSSPPGCRSGTRPGRARHGRDRRDDRRAAAVDRSTSAGSASSRAASRRQAGTSSRPPSGRSGSGSRCASAQARPAGSTTSHRCSTSPAG